MWTSYYRSPVNGGLERRFKTFTQDCFASRATP
jgi:hypothetical protein